MTPEITTGAGWRLAKFRQTLIMHVLQKLQLRLCLWHVSINITKIWLCCLFCVMSDFVLSFMDMGIQVFVHAGLLCNKWNIFKALWLFFFLSKYFCCDLGLRTGLYFPLNSWNISVLPQWKPPRNVVLYQSTGCVPTFELLCQLDAGFQGNTSSG